MITFRDFKEEDKAALLTILNEPQVVKYLSSRIPKPYTLEDAHWWIFTGSKIGIVKAIECNGTLIGCIGADRGVFEYQRSAEVGYWIAKDYWGQGFATHAIKQFIPFVFETTDIVRLFASVFSPNTPSERVLIKCGFKLEAIQKQAIFKEGEFYNSHLFSLLKTY
jgi:RimJ/RimL family protein N-acetyltransferase